MYGNYNPYNQQANIDRINAQINELEKLKNQYQNITSPQPSINQTFQLAPTNTSNMKYATSIEDVNKELVISDTPFFSKDLSVVWIKNAKGEIKSYELNEIIQKDDKDLMIENLQYQISELRKEINNARTNYADVDDTIKNEKPTNVSTIRKVKRKQ